MVAGSLSQGLELTEGSLGKEQEGSCREMEDMLWRMVSGRRGGCSGATQRIG